MEASETSETSVDFYETAGRNFPEDSHLHTHRLETLISRQVGYWCAYYYGTAEVKFCEHFFFVPVPFHITLKYSSFSYINISAGKIVQSLASNC
jgi:hypothetical protein